VLSSSVHVAWALAAGGTLRGKTVRATTKPAASKPSPSPATPNNKPASATSPNNSTPTASASRPPRDADADRHVQRAGKTAAGEPLTAKEKTIHEQGLVSVLKPCTTNSTPPCSTPTAGATYGLLLAPATKHPWPATLPEQMALLARLLAESALTESQLASRITGKGAWKKRLPDLLQTLVALGRARQDGEIWMAV
jgi:hypothetical protein